MKRFALPLLILATVAASFAGGYAAHTWRTTAAIMDARDAHKHVRIKAILSQSEQIGDAETVIFGDSIVEFAKLDFPCAVINAGVGWATINDVSEIISQTLPTTHARAAIIAVGVNDVASHTHSDAFTARYIESVRAVKERGLAVKIALIAPVSDRKPLSEEVDRLNQEILKVATETSVEVISFAALSGAGGHLAPGMSDDGIHLTPSGYKIWTQTLRPSVCGITQRKA
jgi:hypothetical protein